MQWLKVISKDKDCKKPVWCSK